MTQAPRNGLRWDWEVDFPEHGTSVFIIPRERSKNDEERVVMLNRIAKEVVESQRGKHSERVHLRREARWTNAQYVVEKARIRAGIPGLKGS